MLSFPITIGPDHEDVRLSSFTLEVLFDRFQTLASSKLRSLERASAPAYRVDEGEDVGVKQREWVARGPLSVIITKVLYGQLIIYPGPEWGNSRSR